MSKSKGQVWLTKAKGKNWQASWDPPTEYQALDATDIIVLAGINPTSNPQISVLKSKDSNPGDVQVDELGTLGEMW